MSRYFERYYHARNYGCRIKEYVISGMRAISLENEKIKVAILVDKGTDIYEFVYKAKDCDVMWHSFNGIKNIWKTVPTIANPRGPFIDYYEGGWQELFPNIGHPCKYGNASLGNNGEVAVLPWDYTIIEDTPEKIAVKFTVRTLRTPFYLEKTLSLKSDDYTLHIDETVLNEGNIEMDFAWGQHPAFGPTFLDDSCVIHLPEGSKAKVPAADMGPNAHLVRDSRFNFPFGTYNDGTICDVSKVPNIDKNLYHVFYIYDIPEGWYKVTNRNKNISFKMEWDNETFPILWCWGSFGGDNTYPWYGRNYNMALEPWSAVPRNLEEVIRRGKSIKLQPGKTKTVSFKASVYEENE